MSIEIKNLYHSYEGGEYALKNINLSIGEGEFVAIIGQTGSGKSTLVQFFNGLLKVDKKAYKKHACEVTVNGVDTRNKDLRELRKHVGMVFQHPENQLFAETVFDDIAFGLDKQGVDAKKKQEAVEWVADLMHIDREWLGRSPFELSFGQKRRVAIAGVVVMNPDILVLDEPMAGLDPNGREMLAGILRHLHEEKGMTIIMISHSMENVADLAKRVIVMSKGEIVMDGSTKDVFANEAYLNDLALDVPDITKFMSRYSSDICLTVDQAIAIIKERLRGEAYHE